MTARHTEPAATRAAPRWALGWAALVFILAALTLAWPALGGGFLVSVDSDQYLAGYAFREFAAQSVRAGQGIPEWNPYLQGGLPYIAGMHGDIFYPTFLLRLLLPVDVAMTWGFVVHLVLAGLFTYLFLRSWSFGFGPALVGGLAYMMSGQIASLASPGHDGKLFVSALFPLTLLLLVRGVRDGRPWAWGLLALTVGLAVLSPHPQLLQYMLLGAGAFALFIAFGADGEGTRLERNVAFRRLGIALACVVVGFLIGTAQYWPVMEYVEWSPRAEGKKGWEHAISFSMPIEEILNTYLPQFTGILDSYWGRNGIHFHSEYVGASVLVLAGAAFGAGGRRRFTWFWLAALVVALLWALGGNTPFYRLIYAIVPGTKFFRAPSIIFFLVAFSAAVLAALGLERALSGRVGRRYLLGWAAAGLAVALLASLGVLTAVGTTVARPGMYEMVQANAGAVALGAWRSFAFVLLTVGALALLARGRIAPRVALAALALVVTADLWSIDRHYWRWSPAASELFATDATIEYVKSQPEPGRVLALPLQAPMARKDAYLVADGLMVHDIRQVLGYHGNEIGRYQELVHSEGALLNANVWALTNARYLMVNAELPQFERILGPVRNAAGTDVWLYRLPGDNPAAWVTPIVVKATDDQVLPTLLDPRFDPLRAALFDTSAAVEPPGEVTALPEPLGETRVVVTAYEPGRIDLRIDGPVPNGAGLVVSENYYPGWKATVDGRETPVSRVDYALMGVQLPADAEAVSLRFENARADFGQLVTLLAVALSIVLAVAGLVASRRRRV